MISVGGYVYYTTSENVLDRVFNTVSLSTNNTVVGEEVFNSIVKQI
jgi:hypothetical protein